MTEIRYITQLSELLDWMPSVTALQRNRSHDLLLLTTDELGEHWLTCSCGLTAQVDRVFRIPNRNPGARLVTHRYRRRSFGNKVDRWFYRLEGHRDTFYGEVVDAFVAIYPEGRRGGVTRQIVCTQCRSEAQFIYSGKFALYRPETYKLAIDRHLAECLTNTSKRPSE